MNFGISSENSLKTSSSLVARCSKTGKIVATRFGEVLTKEAIEPRPNIKFLGGDFINQTREKIGR